MRTIVPLITLAAVGTAILGGCPSLTLLSQEAANEALVTRFYDEFWNNGDDSVLAELFTVPGYVHKEIGQADFAPQTVQELEDRFDAARAATPDLDYTIDRIFSEGNEVIVQWTVTGTHTGDITGLPATGNTVTYKGITIWIIENGRIIESFTEDDDEDLNDQLT